MKLELGLQIDFDKVGPQGHGRPLRVVAGSNGKSLIQGEPCDPRRWSIQLLDDCVLLLGNVGIRIWS